ncbi:MAG TPA: dihydropteroate synthase [Bacteroidales bacterium]|nr:dihydropteroate synthase [Bacteroidales bacterium]
MVFKDTFFSRNLSINCRGKLMDLSRPRIMGILNVTPDSFFDGGRYTNAESMAVRIRQIVEEGADIIDIGAYSSRPGAEDISAGEETERLLPALEAVKKMYPDMPVSIDTFRTEVIMRATQAFPIDIINDITGGNGDPDMFDLVAESHLPYILMHIQGTPRTMQKDPVYEDVVNDIMMFFAHRVEQLTNKGVNDIILDPGFGFGKTLDHNYTLMASLEVFNSFELPFLVGISRKSMTYSLLNIDKSHALNGTTALNMYALTKGASLLRVHDVKEAVETVKLFNFLHKMEKQG